MEAKDQSDISAFILESTLNHEDLRRRAKVSPTARFRLAYPSTASHFDSLAKEDPETLAEVLRQAPSSNDRREWQRFLNGANLVQPNPTYALRIALKRYGIDLGE